MNILIKSAEILDSTSIFNKKKKNILIEEGIIKSITDAVPAADKIIEGANLKLSTGWFDMRVTIGDPGFEHKEDIESASRAAAFGGFTGIACLPNTKPVIQTKDVIAYIKSKSPSNLVSIYPIASLTIDKLGKDLSEMMDLHHAGAIAFSDGDKPVWHSDVLLKGLQYLKSFDGLLIDHAEDLYLTHYGQMNEGVESTTLGLKGIPKIAEELIIERDLNILEYTNGKIHFPHVSSPRSLELIRAAKKRGLKVTCDIAAYQIALDDSFLKTFDSNLKVNPPLRTKEDIDKIFEALDDDTIDAIVSDHIPQDEESKNLEFDMAEFGMIGLETTFALMNTYGDKRLSLDKIISKLTIAPRKILKLEHPKIEEGQVANLTLFDPTVEWTYNIKEIKSKSKNSPFIGAKLKGKAIAVFNKNQFILN